MKRRIAIVLMSAAMWSTGCGYHVAGRSDALPKSIHVIAVPALEAVRSYEASSSEFGLK